MTSTLAVFGATGQQGSSVINNVLADPELSQRYRLRAITRDTSGPKAKILQNRSVEVVAADFDTPSTLQAALKGVDTAFVVTTPDFTPDAVAIEFARAKAVADAAVSAGVRYLIFSTLSPIEELSGGRYTKVYPYDAKAKAEAYIRTLPIKCAFFCGGPFMQNFAAQVFLAPVKVEREEKWVWKRNNSPKAQYPLIDGVDDTGKFVGAILAEPERYEGKTFYGATRLYTLEEVSRIMSKSTGKKVEYEQISDAEFHADLKAFGGDILADMFVEAFRFYEEYGAFGPGTLEKVEWSVANARGELTTLERFFEKNPLELK
jgi:uncharacterized protein YbjT (DUF2867 family)